MLGTQFYASNIMLLRYARIKSIDVHGVHIVVDCTLLDETVHLQGRIPQMRPAPNAPAVRAKSQGITL